MKEIWVPIKNYEGLYSISNVGNVKSHFRIVTRRNHYPRQVKERILKPILDRKGYLYVSLCKLGIINRFYVHRLVAITFIPNPNNLPEVNHIIIGNTTNNLVENLEWVTHHENMFHAMKHNKHPHPNTPVLCLTNMIEYNSHKEAAKQLNVDPSSISKCVLGKLKHTKGYQFKRI